MPAFPEETQQKSTPALAELCTHLLNNLIDVLKRIKLA